MIVSRELLNKKESREFIYFDNVPVFKCPHSKIDSFCVKCTDYTCKDVNYKTYCYNRNNCEFKQNYHKTPKDINILHNISSALKCVLPFGKMKGKTIEEALDSNPGYLRWLMGVETYGQLASSLLLCSWIIVAEDRNKPCISFSSWGSSDENYGYGYWDDYPEYF